MASSMFTQSAALPYTEIVFAFAASSFLDGYISPILSARLFPEQWKRFNQRDTVQWNARVASLVMSAVMGFGSAWVLLYDTERANMKGWHEKHVGSTRYIRTLGGVCLGYYLWECLYLFRSASSWSSNHLMHSMGGVGVILLTLRPFGSYYVVWGHIFHITNPFLHIHWFCDVLRLTGSLLQLGNGFLWLLTFFWVRVICGGYQTLCFYSDAWNGYRQSRVDPNIPFSPTLALICVMAGVVFNIMNLLWFSKLIKSIHRRFALAASFKKRDGSKPRLELATHRTRTRLPFPRHESHPRLGVIDLIKEAWMRILSFARSFLSTRSLIPSTPQEKLMHELWADILQIDSKTIGRNTNFFQLGGKTTQAARLVAAARGKGLDFAVTDVLASSDLASLASRAKLSSPNFPPPPAIKPFALIDKTVDLVRLRKEAARLCRGTNPASISDIYPCTPIQNALMERSQTDAQLCISTHIIALRADVDVTRLQMAFGIVADSSPILRTRIIKVRSQNHPASALFQVVVKERPHWSTIRSNLREFLKNNQELPPMNFGDPLSLYANVTDDSGGRYLVWNVHRAVCDEWSFSQAIRSVTDAYYGVLPSPTATKFNVLVDQIQRIDRDEARVFWKEQLTGIKASFRPKGLYPNLGKRPSPPREISSLSQRIDIARRLSASAANSDNGTTVSTTLKAAWAMVMARHANGRSIVIAVTNSGQHDNWVPGIIPVRVDIKPEQKVKDLLLGLESQSASSRPFEQLGIEGIRTLDPELEAVCSGLQTVLVIRSSAVGPNDAIHGLGIVATTEDGETVKDIQMADYALVVHCVCNDKDGFIDVSASFDKTRCEERELEKTVKRFARVIDQMLADKETRLKDLLELCQIDRK